MVYGCSFTGFAILRFCVAFSLTTTIMTKGPLRNLHISSPNVIHAVSSSLKSNIIIVAKYSFEAESPQELSVTKGDVLKLLDRPGSGWLLVKFIDKVHAPGLIPASYVDIAVNDPINPITLQWLQEVESSNPHRAKSLRTANFNDSSFVERQIKQAFSENRPVTINNRLYPVEARVANCLLFEDRYWYRVDITYSDNLICHVCRYYQDFYNLHIALLETLTQSKGTSDALLLPKLPEPIPSKRAELDELVSLLMKRCNDLNVYINKLILNKHYQILDAFIDWLDINYGDLAGYAADKSELLLNDETSERVLPGSANILAKLEPEPEPEHEPQHDPKDNSPLPLRSKSKNIYNHYQQVTYVKRTPSLPVLHVNTSPVVSRVDTREFTDLPTQQLPHLELPHVAHQLSPRLQGGRFDPRPNAAAAAAAAAAATQMPTPGPSSRKGSVTRYDSPRQTSGSDNSRGLQNLVFSQVRAPETPRLESNSGAFGFSTPVLAGGTPHIKCKIMTPSNDIIALRVPKHEITSLREFKTIIARKVPFSYLYIRLPNQVDKTFRNIDTLNFNLVEFVRHNDKVLLRVS